MSNEYQADIGIESEAINQARAMVYSLLSSLFAREIDETLWLEMTSKEAEVFWRNLQADDSFKEDIAQIQTQLSLLDNDRARLELAADYCGLFLVGGKNSASPYAGNYLSSSRKDKEQEIFGEFHQQMLAFLHASGLEVESEFPEPADHIAVVLAYCSHLCLAANEAEQYPFIRDYLVTWLTAFEANVHAHDPGKFYRALASFAKSWVKSDLDWLVKK